MLLLPPRKIIIDINLYLSDKLYRFAYKKTCRKAGFFVKMRRVCYRFTMD
jgi:hypothetical protein